MDPIIQLTAIYGSPRRQGNTARLLQRAVAGARDAGAEVTEYVLRDLKISPCLEIYGCKKAGICVLEDDFARVRDQILASDGLMLATPVFFYTVSAHTKMFMDRFQSLWVKKYWVESSAAKSNTTRKALLISVGASKGKKLFDGILLTMRYFFDVLDMELWQALLYRQLDFEDDVLKHPDYLQEAFQKGRDMVDMMTTQKAS
jgi:multimeric flavodoxin WrbA